MGQLPLFEGEDRASPGLVATRIADEDRALAERLPAFVRFGTSSWTFPAWDIWDGRVSQTELARAGLEAYARQPLFTAVGVDRSYYAPLRSDEIEGFAVQVARAERPSFRILTKVWDELTTAVFPRHPRYGARAGTPNPHFLDRERLRSEVLSPYREAARSGGGAEIGPFIVELTPMPPGAIDERTFVARVDAFIADLPTDFSWAFELRNAELFGARWLDMLHANRTAHVFTFWTGMPSLKDQLRVRTLAAPFTVIRLMTPPFTKKASRQADFAPFAKLVAPEPAMRDDVVAILRAAQGHCRDAFVLASNTAEGCAPETLRAIARRVADELGA